jgi:hypothetical protein
VFRYPENIFPGERRAHRFAAIGAAKTVNVLPGVCVQVVGNFIETPGRVLFDLREEFFEGFVVVPHALFERTKIDR